jgi:hypothetical protein
VAEEEAAWGMAWEVPWALVKATPWAGLKDVEGTWGKASPQWALLWAGRLVSRWAVQWAWS